MRPYTYILLHKSTGFKYYGCQYAKNCDPLNFWKSYFTSSKKVKLLIEEYGEDSFEFEIRKKFDDPIKCRKWEIKVIRRMKLVRRMDFLNQRNPGGLDLFIKKNSKSWNYGLKGKNDPRCKNSKKGVKGRYSEEHRKNLAFKSSNQYKNLEVRRRHSNTITGKGNPAHNKIWVNDGNIERRIFENQLLEEEYKNFIRGKLKRICVNNGIEEKYIVPENLQKLELLGYSVGQLQRNRDKVSGKFMKSEKNL